MNVRKRCGRCGVIYNDLTNFGSLQCNMHPSAHGPVGYPCCGKRHKTSWRRRVHPFASAGFHIPDSSSIPRIPGCVRCDHGDGSDVHGGKGLRNITLGELWDVLRKHHSKEFVEKHMIKLVRTLYNTSNVTDTTVLVRVESKCPANVDCNET